MTTIRDLMGFDNEPGLVGLEIEVEGRNLPLGRFLKTWRREEDNSLRGPETGEYVLRRPIPLEKVTSTLLELYGAMERSEMIWSDTGRSGTHVHINCQDLTLAQTVLFATYFIQMEEVFLKFSGEGREGNHFCLGTDAAEGVFRLLIELLTCLEGDAGQLRNFLADVAGDSRYRYAAMNLTALRKYGSIEFRSLPSPITLEKLHSAVLFLTSLRSLAVENGSLKKGELPSDQLDKLARQHLLPHIDCEGFDYEGALRSGWERASLLQNISIYGEPDGTLR